ncbi:predicted ATPase [Jatrophihabitans sp. GAS493]|uniref:ATP-binding protein n=1 Tax=Jatrophihabitans sp. GAS493 TaxID=1907575 RepID=UPI000BB7C70A|nr:LuxR family transcriptional regulator [Jatrophihabitans sp. GAS493]SOD70430.1 predicted ATPase [Jatrophihabitans sp. GAS493]
MVLLEREQEVARLRSATDAAQRGAGSLLWVSGEAGSGKSSLLRAAVPSAIWGFCEPLSTPRPLGPFRDIERKLDRPTAQPRPSDVTSMRERLLDWISDSDSDRLRPPLVIEDAHWIDDASVDVLRFLGRRVAGSRGLIVATFRDELGSDHPLRQLLGDLTGLPAVGRIDLSPLSAAAVTQLVEATDIDADEAYRLTNGNAFLVSELVRTPQAAASSVLDSVTARLMRLSPTTRGVVEFLSVIPGRVSWSLLGAEWKSMDEAVVAGLLNVDGPVVEFRHELVRLAVERELPPGRRRELHTDVAARMQAASGVEPAAIAFHARLARNQPLARSSEIAAAELAIAAGSHRQSAEHLRRVLDSSDTDADPGSDAALWLALSREEYVLGRDAAAVEAAQRAVRLRPAGSDVRLRAVAVCWLGRVTASETEAHELTRSAVQMLEPLGGSPELAEAYAYLATNRMLARDLGVAQEWARRALRLAEEVGAIETQVVALQALGAALTLSGDEPDCRHLRRAVQLAREAGLDAEMGRAYSNLVSAAGEAKLYEVSGLAADEALAEFVARDLDGHANYTRAWHARCLFEQGRWSQATARVDEIIAATATNKTIAAVTAFTIQGRIRARRGDPAVAGALREAAARAALTGSLQRTAPVAAALSEARWLGADVADLDVDFDVDEAELAQNYELAMQLANAWAIGELGLWMWRAGDLDVLPPIAAEPYRRHVNGEPEAAGELWLGIGCPYEAADAWSDSGDEQFVLKSLRIFTDLGARPGRQRAARRLRELGVRSIPRGPRASTAQQADGLTNREQEVLGWVRRGYTDAEIAARLQLSVKTVGHHVSAVLRKTGSRSRRDLQPPNPL